MPRPVPPIHPLPEYAAAGERKARYEDMKAVFQVPWMGVVTMAYAHYPTFFGELWRGARPLCLSRAYVEAFEELRAFTEEAVVELAPPPLAARLTEAGYGAREIDYIRAMIEVFSHGNFPYLLLATITRLLIEGGEPAAAGGAAPAFEGRHAPELSVPFVLMEAHHAEAPVRALYEDVKATLGLPFVNTDYRALCRWPSYFALAWADLKPSLIGAGVHAAICEGVHERALDLALALPNPGALAGEPLRAAAAADAALEEVIGVCRLFQYLLPGLVTNVAFFRQQLLD